MDVANAQISPSRFTTAPHIRAPLNNPPASALAAPAGTLWPGAWLRKAFNCDALGTSWQFAAIALLVARVRTLADNSRRFNTIFVPFLYECSRVRASPRRRHEGSLASPPRRYFFKVTRPLDQAVQALWINAVKKAEPFGARPSL